MEHMNQYEELYRAWIGEKNQNKYFEKMQKGGFSWLTVFLGTFYWITRKMFTESIILILLVCLINTVLGIIGIPNIVFSAISLALSLTLGFTYYYLYRWHIKRKIEKYQKEGLSYEEQLQMARKCSGDKITVGVVVMFIVEIVLITSLNLGMRWVFTVTGSAKQYDNINFNNNNFYTSENSDKLAGTWYDKTNDINLIINTDKTVELYTSDKSTLYIKGTYTIKQDTDNKIEDEYIMNITTTNRKINGQLYTDSYTTQFSLVTGNYKELVMMNTITYSMYDFDKVK